MLYSHEYHQDAKKMGRSKNKRNALLRETSKDCSKSKSKNKSKSRTKSHRQMSKASKDENPLKDKAKKKTAKMKEEYLLKPTV